MKIFKNQRGFTIVEVMVAAGMLGVVSLGVSHVMTNMGKTMKWTESKNEEMALINRFNYELRDQLVCTMTFVGYCEDNNGKIGKYTSKTACDDAQTRAVAPVKYEWKPRNPDRPALDVNGGDIKSVLGRNKIPLFVKNTPYGNGSGRITLTSMTLMKDEANAPVADSQGTAIVRLLLTRNDQTGAIAAKTTAHDVTMTVMWDATATGITECYADREDTILTSRIKACEDIGGFFVVDQNWCKLHAGTDFGTQDTKELSGALLHSRAVEQSYVDDMFRRMCSGPGKIYVPGNGADTPPTCDVDTDRLATVCLDDEYLYKIYFDDNGIDDVSGGGGYATNKKDAADGDTLKWECRKYCQPNNPAAPNYGFYMGRNTATNMPECFKCSAGQIPVAAANGAWTCKNPRGNCTNIEDATHVIIRAFDGWDAAGVAVCREIARHPKNACSGGQVMTGFTTDLTTNPGQATIVPKCCQKGNTSPGVPCPATSTICANGYLAPIDECGFACPGSKDQTVNTSAQPLVYGCEYYMDKVKITRKFPEWTCGTPADPALAASLNPDLATTISTRPCYLGGDKANQTYETCQGVAGAKVAFFSKVESDLGPGASVLTSGKEEDSYCLLPQTYDTSTFGREATAMTNSCVNCNLTAISDVQVRAARSCKAPWKDAVNSYGQLIYQVASTPCSSYGLANVGTTCGSWGEKRSYTIPSDAFLESTATDRAAWPGTFVPDGGYSPVSGTSQSDHGALPDPDTYPTAHYDAWDQDHAGCTDNAVGVTHWESYRCYARISGFSCK